MRQKSKKMAENGRLLNPFDPKNRILSGIRKNGGWVNAHSHPDRSFSLNPQNYDLTNKALQEKWFLNDEYKRNSTVESYYSHIARTVEHMISQGVQAMGAFIDIDEVSRDHAIKAAHRVREEYRGEIKLVFINQVLKGVLDPEAKRWFLEGSQSVDIIGGLPGKDKDREKDHIEMGLETAKSQGKMYHVHVDQLNASNEKETELLADRTIALGMQGKVVAVHGISIAAHPEEDRKWLYQRMREAGLMVVCCPSAWIDSQRREDLAVTHNSIVPVEELMREGIPVALGTDNINDIYKPFSDGDMWTELRFLLESCRYYDIENLINIGSVNGLKTLGLETPSVKIEAA